MLTSTLSSVHSSPAKPSPANSASAKPGSINPASVNAVSVNAGSFNAGSAIPGSVNPESPGAAMLRKEQRLRLVSSRQGVQPNASTLAVHDGDGHDGNRQVAGMLSTWKDISAYLGRGVRTVQRWENNLGLPVHRIGTGNRPPVFAFEHEIDSWLRGAGAEASSEPPTEDGREHSDSNHSDSGQQSIGKLLQELRSKALELEQQLAANAARPNGKVVEILLSIEQLATSALQQCQNSTLAASAD